MLKGLSPLLSPDLLFALASMGHGDEIALVDANFPAASQSRRLLPMAGVGVPELLDAVLSVMPLDDFAPEPVLTMQVVGDADGEPAIWRDFAAMLRKHGGPPARPIERLVFYQRAAAAYAVVATGETRLYGNILLRKGVVRS